MKDILTIFIILLFVLLLISTFGGSLRQQPEQTIIVNSEERMTSEDEYERKPNRRPIQESTFEEDDNEGVAGDLAGFEVSKSFASFDS
jgi:hypothetical protein